MPAINCVSKMKLPLLQNRVKKKICAFLWYVVCIILAFIYCFPFIYMIFSAFQPNNESIFVLPPRMIPKVFRFQNFADAFVEMHFIRSLGNTMLIVVCNMGLNLTGSLCVAYGFSRFNARGKNIVFSVLMGTMMLPWVVTFVPSYAVFKYLGLTGTFLPLILPAFGGGAYNIFMLRQYMMGIPRDLDEAAKMDGCSAAGILIRILVPNMKPILATLIVFQFSAIWSDWLGPSIYLLDESMQTLSLSLYNLRSAYAVDWTLTIAGSVMFAVPMIIVLFSSQKYFTEGVVAASFK